MESIRVYLNTGMKLGAAMDQAIEDCIRLDILKELLLKHRGEVKQVILTEYNEERHAKTLLEEGRRQGREESARLLQIEREENARLLQKEQDPKLLQLWISFAGDIDSAEELEKMILEKR